MIRIFGNMLDQVVLAVFYIAVIVLAVKLGIQKAKKKNLKESENIAE